MDAVSHAAAAAKERGILFSAAIRERFFALVSPEPNTGCWLWAGSINGKGYGRTGSGRMAHVVSVLLHGREIPEGYEVDHKCRVRCCVNPDHLDVVTHIVNIQRKEPPPSTCPSGHNRFVVRQGKRSCMECARLRAVAAYRPRAGAVRRRGRRWLTQEEKQQIMDGLAAGKTHAAIAGIVRTSIATISRYRNA